MHFGWRRLGQRRNLLEEKKSCRRWPPSRDIKTCFVWLGWCRDGILSDGSAYRATKCDFVVGRCDDWLILIVTAVSIFCVVRAFILQTAHYFTYGVFVVACQKVRIGIKLAVWPDNRRMLCCWVQGNRYGAYCTVIGSPFEIIAPMNKLCVRCSSPIQVFFAFLAQKQPSFLVLDAGQDAWVIWPWNGNAKCSRP